MFYLLLGKTQNKHARDPAEPDIIDPIGFFKVVFKPAAAGRPAEAIGFLFPQTAQEGYDYWKLRTTIAVIEKASGLDFHSSDSSLKGQWTANTWKAPKLPAGWSVPSRSCRTVRRPQAWNMQLSPEKRLEVCVAAGQ